MKWRRLHLGAAAGLLVAACGVPTPAEQATTAATVPEGSTTAVAAPGPPAPDFTLALGDGGEFTLSEEQKPVYMVFWAEW